MKILYTLTLFVLSQLFACGQEKSIKSEFNEDYYISVKNNLDKRINTNIDYKDPTLDQRDELYLDSLNYILKKVLQDHPLKNIFVNGTSSLETLIPEMGYGKLDAVQVFRDSSLLSYTTAELLKNNNSEITDINNLSVENLGDVFHSLCPDAAVIGISSSKIMDYNEIDQIFFLVALVSQDPYYKQPKNVFAIWNIEDDIYIMRSDDTQIELEECDKIWSEVNEEKDKEMEKYRVLHPNLKPYEYNSYEIILERKSYQKYGECYQSKRNQAIIEEAKQKIIKKIEKLIAAANRLE